MKNFTRDYIKAYRKKSREDELDYEQGFKSRNRIHKSSKKYSRKRKGSFDPND